MFEPVPLSSCSLAHCRRRCRLCPAGACPAPTLRLPCTQPSPRPRHLPRGRNSEGQCGVASYLPLLLQPRQVEAFAGLPVASLAAAKSHSAGVLESGEVLTWGEGSDGKLGLGGTGGLAAGEGCAGPGVWHALVARPERDCRGARAAGCTNAARIWLPATSPCGTLVTSCCQHPPPPCR